MSGSQKKLGLKDVALAPEAIEKEVEAAPVLPWWRKVFSSPTKEEKPAVEEEKVGLSCTTSC